MKYVFGSREWIAFMHGLVVERVAGLGPAARGLTWSFCEVFTDPPADLSPDGAPIAWHYFVEDGEVQFGDTDRRDVAYRVVFDYGAVLPLGRYDTRGDPTRTAELARMAADLRARGLMILVADGDRDPRIGNLHDPIARVTA